MYEKKSGKKSGKRYTGTGTREKKSPAERGRPREGGGARRVPSMAGSGLRIGEVQTLFVVKTVDFGCYLSPVRGDEADKVLLPAKQVPEGTGIGDSIPVFVYRDSDDRLIATVRRPLIALHEVKRLFVRETGRVGAFMDWGLEKDVLLPFHEQTRRVEQGESVLCALYVDRSGRLAVTMNVYPYLQTKAPYIRDDRVDGTVYELSDNFGAFVAVDDRYSALIPKKELLGDIRIGDRLTGLRVTDVKPDGRLTLSLREKAYRQMETDAETLLAWMELHDGRIPFSDNAPPEVIRETFSMSKAAFKRAVGRLLKEGKIVLADTEIRRCGITAQE